MEIRAFASKTLSNGVRRRAFWERFCEHAFGAPPSIESARALEAFASELVRDERAEDGKVTLVGAGPGDAELLTLKAVRALQAADVILYDDLVSDEVLELARREAKRMLVGKRGRRQSCAQNDINDLMVKLARQGKHVVRLKSGDPMIFGRAGEEIERLHREGIAVAVVPGITSASAMAAALGVSLTHRDCAQSVRFITGHSRDGELPADLDWTGLAHPRTTLVVYMGGKTAALLARRLMAAGLDGDTPAVAMSSASRVDAKSWRASVAVLADAGLPNDLSTPVLVGIGEAFKLPAHIAEAAKDSVGAAEATAGRSKIEGNGPTALR
jgi:uroporphyrin-III C-methyltransferase/precorrin-2 dehydrogenase/sirohydrochlorin ferrochelatase